MRRFNLYLPASQIKALLALAKKTNVSIAELIRRAIEAFLKDHK